MEDTGYLIEVKNTIPAIKDLLFPRFKHYYYPELIKALKKEDINRVKFCINRMWYFLPEYDKDLREIATSNIYKLWSLKQLDRTQYENSEMIRRCV